MSPGVKGCGLVFLLFPVAHAVVQGCFDRGLAQIAGMIFFLLGFTLMVGSWKVSSNNSRAILGLLAGFLLWAAVGEVPHHTGQGLHVGPDNWGLVLVIGVSYLLFQGTQGVAVPAQGVQIAFEFFLVVWALHVLLLTAYYDPRFGVESWLTRGIFLAVIFLIFPLARGLRSIRELRIGIRIGVIVAGLLWTGVEILMKWGYLPKPWKPMNLLSITVCAVLLAVWSAWPTSSAGDRR